MTAGRARSLEGLPSDIRGVIESARRAVFATVGPSGTPKTVPVVSVIVGDEIVSPIDDKPKSGRRLARVRNLSRDPRASMLFDRWSENWAELVWVRVEGTTRIASLGPAAQLLRQRHPQYDDEELDVNVEPSFEGIWLRPRRIAWWSWS